MNKKKVTAPLTYDPGKGRPKEHLAYLNWQEMQALKRLNGNNQERGPMGLPSFPPGGTTGKSSANSGGGKTTGKSTTKSSGPSKSSGPGGGMMGGSGSGGSSRTAPSKANAAGKDSGAGRTGGGGGSRSVGGGGGGGANRGAGPRSGVSGSRSPTSGSTKGSGKGPSMSKAGPGASGSKGIAGLSQTVNRAGKGDIAQTVNRSGKGDIGGYKRPTGDTPGTRVKGAIEGIKSAATTSAETLAKQRQRVADQLARTGPFGPTAYGGVYNSATGRFDGKPVAARPAVPIDPGIRSRLSMPKYSPSTPQKIGMDPSIPGRLAKANEKPKPVTGSSIVKTPQEQSLERALKDIGMMYSPPSAVDQLSQAMSPYTTGEIAMRNAISAPGYSTDYGNVITNSAIDQGFEQAALSSKYGLSAPSMQPGATPPASSPSRPKQITDRMTVEKYIDRGVAGVPGGLPQRGVKTFDTRPAAVAPVKGNPFRSFGSDAYRDQIDTVSGAMPQGAGPRFKTVDKPVEINISGGPVSRPSLGYSFDPNSETQKAAIDRGLTESIVNSYVNALDPKTTSPSLPKKVGKYDVYNPADYANSLAIQVPSPAQSLPEGYVGKAKTRGIPSPTSAEERILGVEDVPESSLVGLVGEEARKAAKEYGIPESVIRSPGFLDDPTRLGVMPTQQPRLSATDMAKLHAKAYGENYLTKSERAQAAVTKGLLRGGRAALNMALPGSGTLAGGIGKLVGAEPVDSFLGRPSYEQSYLRDLAKAEDVRYGRDPMGRTSYTMADGTVVNYEGPKFGQGGGGRDSGIAALTPRSETVAPTPTESTTGTKKPEEKGPRPAIYYQWDLGVNIPSPSDPNYTQYQTYLAERAAAQAAMYG